jgi:DNA-binding response OmpR family regulator
MPRILLAEDDVRLQQAIRDMLSSEQYETTVCSDGEAALYHATSGSYDLILLDVMLPGLDGFGVAMACRKQKVLTPIIMLTAKDLVEDRVKGLDSGADDYLTKPFNSTELFARIRAQLRRTSPDYHDVELLEFGGLTYRFSTRELTVGPRTLRMTRKEAILIELFLRYPDMVLTRQQLMDRLWGDDSEILDNTLEAHVSKLRKRLASVGGPDIVAVRGLGYRLDKAR